ncbi:uncharacterized protein LOC128224056 [Mya arenaria]|uniref:uncharacterized protein LOC128223692 n=1 Tax=Mya arenaria TaxID=6604 RepID=UPI0022E50770|nr:uncharacterized protein LOC128223692 [Mya arenaria]XP_052789651.1 uncharacterized protein LOC128224056 [Mya arenaria]
MATRVTSPDSSSSAGDIPIVSGLSKPSAHPEEWTLPHEWNIEKREMYDNWKMDVQNQISNIAEMLTSSLQKHPRPEVSTIDYSDAIEENDLRKQVIGKERESGNTLTYGLARVPFPDKY